MATQSPVRGQTYTVSTKKGLVPAKFTAETWAYYIFQPTSGGKEIIMRKSMFGKRVANPRSRPSLIHHSIGYPTKAEAERARRKLGHGKVRKAGGWWYVVGPKGNPQKWLLPFRRGKKNYEDVGYLPLVLEHDIGFAGDKTYHIVKRGVGTGERAGQPAFFHVSLGDAWSPGHTNLFYKRSEAVAAIKQLARSQNPGPSSIPTRWTKATVYRAGGKIMAKIGGR